MRSRDDLALAPRRKQLCAVLAAAGVLRRPHPDPLAALEDGRNAAAREAGDSRLALEIADLVERRRRRRGGPGRADGGRGLPARSAALRAARREGAEGSSPLRPAGYRQDAAREGGRP